MKAASNQRLRLFCLQGIAVVLSEVKNPMRIPAEWMLHRPSGSSERQMNRVSEHTMTQTIDKTIKDMSESGVPGQP